MHNEKKLQEQKSWSTVFRLFLSEKAKCNISYPSYSVSDEKLYLNKPLWGRSLHMEILDDFHCFG